MAVADKFLRNTKGWVRDGRYIKDECDHVMATCPDEITAATLLSCVNIANIARDEIEKSNKSNAESPLPSVIGQRRA